MSEPDYSSLAALQDLMGQREELDEDLEAWLDDGPLGGKSLRHPLVYSVFHAPEMNALVNAQLRQKRLALQRAAKERNWNSFVYLHERPWRIDAFTNICYQLGDRKYWELLGSIYTDTENLYQNVDTWVECLTADRRYRSAMMTADERAALAQDYDPTITVYRGFHDPGSVEGLSWTTNSVVGKFFARRLAAPGAKRYLAQGRVKRRDVLAYFDGRSEYEAVILPGKVQDIEITEIQGGAE